jgi:DNA-binding transcriptional MerR regulator
MMDAMTTISLDGNLPIFTIDMMGQYTETHPRSLMSYEKFNLIRPHRTKGGRRRFCLAQASVVKAIRRATVLGIGLESCRDTFKMLVDLDEEGCPVPERFVEVLALLKEGGYTQLPPLPAS